MFCNIPFKKNGFFIIGVLKFGLVLKTPDAAAKRTDQQKELLISTVC